MERGENLNGGSGPPASRDGTQQTYLILPCSQDRFGEFISSLLGKPQVITRRYGGRLRITLDEIKSLHALLQQRIQEQNQANLLQFAGRVFYSDSSSVEVQGFEEFLTYAEVRPLESIRVNLTWIYLVQFPLKRTPERQQIDVEFSVGHHGFDRDFDAMTYHFRSNRRYARAFAGGTGRVRLIITHTARGWAGDIESLLSAHIQSSIREQAGIRRWVSNHTGFVTAMLFLSIFSVELRGASSLLDRIQYFRREGLTAPSAHTTQFDTIESQLANISSFLFGQKPLKESMMFSILGLGMVAMAVLLSALISELAESHEPSFLLLTKKSIEAEARITRDYERSWTSFFITSSLSVMLGILSNILYALFW